MKKNFLSATILALILLGCSDPKTANKENFETVINKYLLESKDTFTCSSLGDEFPLTDKFGTRIKYFQEYVELGLLKESKEEKIIKDFLTRADKKVEISTYDLTERGREHYKNGKFCFGTPKVEQIINFSEPMDFMGQKVTEVNYKIKLENLPEWYKKDTVKERKIGLRLMNDGWTYK